MSEVEFAGVAGIATATLTVLGTALAALRYLWVRDPASARNGTLDRIAESQSAMANAIIRVSETQLEAIRATEKHEARADARHTATMHYIEKLADVVAPRTAVRGHE